MYHFFSLYGESLRRPAIIGIVIIVSTTLFWLTQSHPLLAPQLFEGTDVTNEAHNITNSKLIGFSQIGNLTHWVKATERSVADFLPVLQLGSRIEVSLFDYIVKLLGAVLTFGLLAIALRRKFERRFRH